MFTSTLNQGGRKKNYDGKNETKVELKLPVELLTLGSFIFTPRFSLLDVPAQPNEKFCNKAELWAVGFNFSFNFYFNFFHNKQLRYVLFRFSVFFGRILHYILNHTLIGQSLFNCYPDIVKILYA